MASLVLVLCVAAALRFWGLDQGVPYAIGVDEPEIMARVVTMMKTGDFNPHFFDYGGLSFNLHLPVAIARFLTGAMAGEWGSLDEVDASDFYVWGRALTAILGTATVFLLYQVGLRWGARHALLAAGLLAVLPPHVRESHFVLADVPATFFATLTLLLSLVAHEKAAWRAFFWAGAAAGLTIATKYNAGVVLLIPLIAAGMTLDAAPSRLACLLAVVGGTAAGVLAGAPYTLLDLPAFLNGFAHLTTSYRPRTQGEPGWVIYLKHLRLALQWPALLLLFAGLALGLVRAFRGPGRVRWVLLLAFPLVYFAAIANRSLIFGRYLLPLLPSVCLIAAIALVSGVSLLRRVNVSRTPRRLLIAAGTIATIVPPLLLSIGFAQAMARESTQELTYRWVTANLPRGSRIAIEKYDLRLDGPRFRTEHVVRLVDRDREAYTKAGFQYLIASSQVFGPFLDAPQRDPDTYARYRALFEQSKQLLVVRPSRKHPGPELRVYQLNGVR